VDWCLFLGFLLHFSCHFFLAFLRVSPHVRVTLGYFQSSPHPHKNTKSLVCHLLPFNIPRLFFFSKIFFFFPRVEGLPPVALPCNHMFFLFFYRSLSPPFLLFFFLFSPLCLPPLEDGCRSSLSLPYYFIELWYPEEAFTVYASLFSLQFK